MFVFNLPWKRMLSTLFAIAFAGCSIIPEGAVETIPDNLSLIQIVATSYSQNSGETSSETLVGKASSSGNQTSLTFSGNLDLHSFPQRLSKLSYIEANGLVTMVTLTFSDGNTQSESFDYDSQDRLIKATVTRDGVTEVDDFFYIGSVLDSIAKKVTDADNNIEKGFFKRHVSQYDARYRSIFPYNSASDGTPDFGCNFITQDDYESNFSEYVEPLPNDREGIVMQSASFIKTDETTPNGDPNNYEYTAVNKYHELDFNRGPVDGHLKDIDYSFIDCDGNPHWIKSVPYYVFIDTLPENTFRQLWMLAEARDSKAAFENPVNTTEHATLIIDFQYENK